MSQTFLNDYNGKAIVAVRELSKQEFQDQCNSTYGIFMMKKALEKKNLTITMNRTLTTTAKPTTTTTTTRILTARRKRRFVDLSDAVGVVADAVGRAALVGRAAPVVTTPIPETTTIPEKPELPTLLTNEIRKQSFSEDYYIRFLIGGCYYRDVKSGKWSSYGVNELEKTNIDMTCCETTHLTEFAGGFLTLPSTIDFNDIWTRASFMENPTIYVTVIVLSCLYIFLAVFSTIMDRRDKERISFTMVDDTTHEDDFFYELILFTGTRKEAQTNSKVSCIITGDLGESTLKSLADKEARLFRRGAVNSFLISSPS